MLSSFLKERKKLVFARHSDLDGMPVGQMVDAVIDPDTGIIAAWWIRSVDGLRVILPEDIQAWEEEKIIISDEHDLSEPTALPKLKKVFAKEVPILNANVFYRKKSLGVVKDFLFDSISPRLLKIDIGKSWWGFGQKRLVSAEHISKITEEGIFVSTSLKGLKNAEASLEMPTNAEVEPD